MKKWLLISVFAVAAMACSEEDCTDTGTCPEQSVTERTDLTISGDFSSSQYLSSVEDDKGLDLISYNFFGQPSEKFDFVIRMENGDRLVIRIVNADKLNPWQYANIDYATYPTSVLEDKFRYVTADYVIGNESPTYSSNLGLSYPQGITLDVFRITAYDGVEIQCRIRDLVLYKNTDPSRTIEIDGTFVGAVTFLN